MESFFLLTVFIIILDIPPYFRDEELGTQGEKRWGWIQAGYTKEQPGLQVEGRGCSGSGVEGASIR